MQIIHSPNIRDFTYKLEEIMASIGTALNNQIYFYLLAITKNFLITIYFFFGAHRFIRII